MGRLAGRRHGVGGFRVPPPLCQRLLEHPGTEHLDGHASPKSSGVWRDGAGLLPQKFHQSFEAEGGEL